MKKFIRSIALRFLSAGELSALKMMRKERAISKYHRAGLRAIRKQSLSRPAKLNLGSGSFRKIGYLNVDMFPGGDITLDIRRVLPFESGCCGEIFSEHCFEHFDYPEPISFLMSECLRVLKPGGQFRFSVPGTEWPLTDYRDGPSAPYFQACDVHNWHPKECTTRLEHINFHFRQGGEHRFSYDFETIEKLLSTAGFIGIQPDAFDPSLDSKHREIGSLFVKARRQP